MIPQTRPIANLVFRSVIAQRAALAARAAASPKKAVAPPRHPRASAAIRHPRQPAAPVADFSHLGQAAAKRSAVAAAERARLSAWQGSPVVDDPQALAGDILAAGRQSRRATGGPPPTGIAARIVAAGKKRRGEIR